MNQAESDDSGRSLFDNETPNATILDQSDDKENIHETEKPPEEATTTPAADKRVTLNMVLREALFFLALALTTYDALQNSVFSPPKISRTPTAVPFFEKGSLVTDWYKGQVSTALSFISMSEVSFVMYYAPWDAESQHVRHEFDLAAQTMFKQVHFSAINCWHPGGECRLHHNKISTWPIIMVYTTHLKSIMYTGPKDSASMVRFLRQVTKPIRRVTSTDNLINLAAKCDAVVIGFMPITVKATDYHTLYSVALKSLELDPFGDVCFCVVTSEELAQEMGVDVLPTVRLMVWNETLEYPESSTFKVDGIMQWIWSHMAKKVTWYTPQWQKSFNMQKIFAMGPVLIMFTPRNHYFEEIPNYNLLQEVSLEYNNCPQLSTWITEMTQVTKSQRLRYLEYERNMTLMCADPSLDSNLSPHEHIPKTKPSHPPVNKANKKTWLNRTVCKSEYNTKNLQSFLFRDRSQSTISEVGSGSVEVVGWPGCCSNGEGSSCSSDDRPIAPADDDSESFEELIKKLTMGSGTKTYKTSMLQSANDPRAPINLQKRRMREICILLALGRKHHPQVYPVRDQTGARHARPPPPGTVVEGLACKTNRSLLMFAIDSLFNHHFAESLGIDIMNAKDHTALVILDSESESQYVLNEPFGETSLREFIFNYTMNILPRDLRSVAVNAEYTHYYGSDQVKEQAATGDTKNFRRSANPWCQRDKTNGEIVCISELNTSNFKDFIMQRNKAVLVALCGAGSGACGGLLSLALLAVARILQTPGLLQVGRIDPNKHDLPWQYTVSKYPTLVFFPMRQKEESRSYPDNQPITIEGVLAFILSGMEPPLKLHAKVLLCNQTQDDDSMKACLTNVRLDTVSLIGKTLKQWRRFHDTSIKSLLLKRLQCLRTLAITLGSLNTTKLPSTHPILTSFTETIKTLTQTWNANIQTSNLKKFRLSNKSMNFTLL